LRSPLRNPAPTIGRLATTKLNFYSGLIEAGLRSPLRNPASTIGCLATTKLNLSLGLIEAGSRSPLHNPASTHGRLSTTDLIIAFSNLAVTSSSPTTPREMAMSVPRLDNRNWSPDVLLFFGNGPVLCRFLTQVNFGWPRRVRYRRSQAGNGMSLSGDRVQ